MRSSMSASWAACSSVQHTLSKVSKLATSVDFKARTVIVGVLFSWVDGVRRGNR